jgi:NAD(P)-dependent dehydrogenase (short-subunit alcohol dehydrogenase family)
MNERFLNGKLAFISGGSRSLGETIALELADCGADILINDLKDALDDVRKAELVSRIEAKGVRAFFMEGDVGENASVEAMSGAITRDIGVVQIVVNCAGPFNTSPFLTLAERDWNLVMDVNLKAMYLTAKYFCPGMKTTGWGRIVSMSAGSSSVRNHGVYGLAKSGVRFLTEELALELGPSITVNAVAPGQIEESLPYIHTIDPTFGARYTAKAPLGKLVRRIDVARIVSMLCSPLADMITGETIRIDGGAELPRF